MSGAIFNTTTGKDGSIKIPRTDLPPGTKVRVQVEMAGAVERHGLEQYRPVRFSRTFRFSGDPVAVRRKMRDEWER